MGFNGDGKTYISDSSIMNTRIIDYGANLLSSIDVIMIMLIILLCIFW